MTPRIASTEALQRVISEYRSTAITNDAIYELFTERTNQNPMLREHRDWVEANKWGFGDRAFHYMWLLLLQNLHESGRADVELLEIGVFKGQTISLWTLIAQELQLGAHVTGITPLTGKPPLPPLLHRTRMLLDRKYRQDAHVGNLHIRSDYKDDIEKIFRNFGLEFGDVTLVRGLSQDESVHAQVRGKSFDLVYVDGGHRYEEVAADLKLYGPLVREGGYLVVDDAAYFEPGSAFFKGFESVSTAANELDPRRYANVLNVGHNRIYKIRCASAQ